MKWQVFDKICKKEHLKKKNIKPISFDDDDHLKKGLYWEVPMKNFQGQDFYHTFGVPGIFFNGFLPVDEIKDIEPYESEMPGVNGFAYYNFEIKNEEMFYKILNLVRKIRWNNKEDSLEIKS